MRYLENILAVLLFIWCLGWIELIATRQYLIRHYPQMQVGPEVWTDYVWPIHDAKKIRESADKAIAEKYNTWQPPYLR